MPLTRLDLIDEGMAVALAGPDAEMFGIGSTVIAFGPAGPVIIADAVDELTTSGVWNSREFRLRGPGPATIAARIWEADPFQRAHVFTRLKDRCIYLGTAQRVRGEQTREQFVLCVWRLDSELSREVLDTVRPPSTPVALPDLEWLDYVRTDPATALERFVTGWYPASEAPSRPKLSNCTPGPLASFYRLAQERPAILGAQNRILPEAKLYTDDSADHLVFGEENQGGFVWSFRWSLDFAESDPTVWFTEEEPSPEREPMSGFLLQFSLFEAVVSAPYWASVDCLPERLTREITRTLHQVPLRPWQWPSDPTHFYVAPGLAAYVSDHGNGGFDVWVGAKHRNALRPLGERGFSWRRFDG
ncbi:hypothetical protein ACIQF6_18905 [Kitasatospora sp. NPDC092948]|uniref:hypothetical protein n=1 Tax=Kitasatospora sp. NPDC092948 TaxID=3364088 RepID=UPI00382A1926